MSYSLPVFILFLSLLCYTNSSEWTTKSPSCQNTTDGSGFHCGGNETATGIASELHIIKGDPDAVQPGESKKDVMGIMKWVAIGAGVFVLFLALTTMFANMIPMLDPCGISGAICDFFKSWFCCSCSATMGCCTIS